MKKALCALAHVLLCVLLVVPFTAAEDDMDSFDPLYTARVTRQSSLRDTDSKGGKLVATLYRNDLVELGEIGDEWTHARKGGKVGYILTESLKDLDILSPYQSLQDGETHFPYAATALAPVAITGTVYGQTGELQTIPEGAVVAVGNPDDNGDVLLPYKRTIGQLSGASVRLDPVMPVEEAQPGDLIGVYSTFFNADMGRELIVGRLHNIEKGVNLLDGYKISAGSQFSFNDIAAPYTRSNGYALGPIINYTSDKKTGYGGGICQVSTTLYNVVLQLPMEIVRSQPHSSRGIDYAPVGFDAAVGNGGLDFTFFNNAPYAVRMRVNVWDGVITVRMYRDAEEPT